MNARPLPLTLLLILYLIATILAFWRAINLQVLDLFSIISFLVVIGLIKPMSWSHLVLKVYIVLQSFAVVAFAVVTLIAWHVTPDKLQQSIAALPIPVNVLVPLIIVLLGLQYFIIFRASTKRYLNQTSEQDTKN